ncbi:immunoglobulin superfamily member 3-like [Sardina pilchardus]|uniref:immunoglobulin superfamily member 3-like n=1 Tax=Sardina pilchardus TaxID=27697 RepID=UPI002E125103
MESQVHMWPFCHLLCLLGLLQIDVGQAQRMVTIQAGPLYRVKGFPVAITCSVSGFKGKDEQDFSFSAYRATRPDQEIQMISTGDENFAYAVFSSRVRSKDIWIERQSGSSVVFHINNALLEDTAEIECHTPNTDGSYWGTYSAKTSLNVVEDTLVTTYSGPSPVTLFEGDTLQLECQASSQTFQHTHLSVTWLLHAKGEAEPRPVISLDRDLTVRPGAGYEERYKSRQVVIEKVEETRYQLRVAKVQQGDQGSIFCRVQEWIQDPDRSWVTVAKRGASPADVVVKAVDVAADSFAANIDVAKADLQEGEAVEVRCSVQTQKLPELFFTVAWFKDEQELARVGPLGKLTVSSAYERREREGELRVAKTTEKDYLLTLRPVRAEDQGAYQCRVWLETRGPGGVFSQAQSEQSQSQQVTITPKASGLRVSMVPSLSVTEGAPLILSCNVSGPHGELSVAWRHKTVSQGSSFSEVVSLSREGVMELAPNFRQRQALRTFRSADGIVVLEMGEAGVADAGVYECTVSEWSGSNGGEKTASQSQECSVQVTAIDELVKVALKSRTTNVEVNKEISLLCRVGAPKVPLSVTWQYLQTASSKPQMVVSLSHTGDIAWGRETEGYQLSTVVSEENTQYTLAMTKASLHNTGLYKCEVGAFLKQTQRAKKLSNPLGVNVRKPASKLSLTPSSALRSVVNSDIQVSCAVSGATSNSSRFNVTWDVGGRVVASSDLDGVVTLHDAGKRTGTNTLPGPKFELALRQTGASDSGVYTCQVQEWLQDPSGEWYSLPPKTATVEVTISEKPSNFRLDKASTQTKEREGGQVDLTCSIISGVDDPSSHFSLTWYFQSPSTGSDSPTLTLLTYSQQGDLTYGDDPAGLQSRLRFSRTDPKTYRLTVANVEPGDSGKYWCGVEQYQHGCTGVWEKKGSGETGVTQVIVEPIAASLDLQKTSKSVTTKPQDGFNVDCVIESRSSDRSVFEVTWSRTQNKGISQMVFNASRDGTFRAMDSPAGGLMLKRPTPMQFDLKYLSVGPSEVGIYSCHVTEWLLMPDKSWRKLAENRSGELNVNIQTEVKSDFSLNKTSRNREVTEGQRLDLECSVQTEGSDPSSSIYTVTWLFQRLGSDGSVALLTQMFNGHLKVHEGYQDRLRFSHPTKDTFGLSILTAVPSDSGAYHCKVEVRQHACGGDGQWKTVASDQSGVITVSVGELEGNLLLDKRDRLLNVTDLRAGFNVDCHVTSKSSEESLFEVTWFRGEDKKQKKAIFRSARNGTLQNLDKDRKGLVFARPTLTLFTLTVPLVGATDAGQYSCEVAEWVKTVTNTWKKMATDQSGKSTVLIAKNLHLDKQDHLLDVTDLQAGFNVDCNITSKSSEESLFEVTWFRGEDKKEAIFRSARDGTLQNLDKDRMGLVFARPTLTLFTLTMSHVGATDSGQYSCEVAEWVKTVTNTWVKMATDQSGKSTVLIAAPVAGSPDVTIPVCVVIMLILAAAVVFLAVKLRKTTVAQKENKNSLWAENNPLKPTTEA